MPRQIIDTQSSRPAYIRRNVIAAVLVILIVAAGLLAGYVLWGRTPALHPLGPAVPAAPFSPRHQPVPGK